MRLLPVDNFLPAHHHYMQDTAALEAVRSADICGARKLLFVSRADSQFVHGVLVIVTHSLGPVSFCFMISDVKTISVRP